MQYSGMTLMISTILCTAQEPCLFRLLLWLSGLFLAYGLFLPVAARHARVSCCSSGVGLSTGADLPLFLRHFSMTELVTFPKSAVSVRHHPKHQALLSVVGGFLRRLIQIKLSAPISFPSRCTLHVGALW